MDYGYHVSMGQTMTINVQLEKAVCLRHIDILQCVQNDAHDLNLGVDLQAFIQASHPTFSLPKKYEYQPHMGDKVHNQLADGWTNDGCVVLKDRKMTKSDN